VNYRPQNIIKGGVFMVTGAIIATCGIAIGVCISELVRIRIKK
jgi:ABC-type lipoprotein release transport system permease subunit